MRIRTLAALTACLATAGTAAVTAPAAGAEDRGGTADAAAVSAGAAADDRAVRADFDGDGFADLAVGVPYEAIGSKQSAGSVVLLKGGSDGLKTRGAQAFHQDTPGVKGVAETGDRFGLALAFGDVTGDGRAELAVGAPEENGTGAIWSLRGAAGGLTATGSVAFSPDNFEGPGRTGGARFGTGFADEDLGHYLMGQE
ncbi:integrin alpha [Streptomyces sp. NBC_01808]|uniref:FG-GAP repeat protein n=1 Tax=Streptomyces sp. NBC_01808 TaxID=2975947 RepID=UPI002DDC72AF|nr:FG-GAP repeat protein [Streptomyces sp. NBC_01808]WSA39303.1 integrin alpha [Streptomyces sp. NBC_01808]